MNGPALRDIQLPPAPWWPLAPGWWVVLGVVLLAGLAVAFAVWRWRRRGALRAALAELDRLQSAYAADGNAHALVDGASRLMRRVARRVDAHAAATSGVAWQAFVARYARGSARHTLRQFDAARFRAEPSIDADRLLAALRAWCRRALGHRRPFASRAPAA